jgi:hypothetical protein
MVALLLPPSTFILLQCLFYVLLQRNKEGDGNNATIAFFCFLAT